MTFFKNKHIVALCLLLLLWVIFFWRLYAPSAESQVVFPPGDFTVQFYGFSRYQADRVLDGELPLWNPYNNAGSPFAADPQAAVFYPPRWLSIWLSGGNGWSVLDLQREVAAHYWLGSILMYAFLFFTTRHMPASVIGAVIFAYGGFLTGYPMLQVAVLLSTVWLPLVLLGILLSFRYEHWRYRGLGLGGIGLGLSILGGHPQTVLYVGYISLAYLICMAYRSRASLFDTVRSIVLLYGTGVGLGLVQLLPAYKFLSLATRDAAFSYPDKSAGFAFADLPSLIWPTVDGWVPLYAGVAGLVLALGAMTRRENAFWTGLTVVSLLISLGGHSVVYNIAYVFLPGFSMFRQQERLAVGVALGLSVLAARQIVWLFSGEKEPRGAFQRIIYAHTAVTGLVALYLIAGTFEARAVNEPQLSMVIFVALLSAGFLLWSRWQATTVDDTRIVAGALLALIVLDLFSVGAQSPNFLPNVEENRVSTPPFVAQTQITNPDEILWRVDGAAGLQHYGNYFRVPDIYGTSPLYLKSIDRIRQLPVDRFWELLAVRYVTNSDPLPEGFDATPIGGGVNFDGQPYEVYEVNNPRPLAQLVYNHILGHNYDFTLAIIADPAVDLRETVVTRGNLPLELPGERPESAQVRSISFQSPEHLEVEIDSPENAILTIAIPYYPGWQAEVNGDDVDVIETYGGLMGIPVRGSTETQQINLRFQPLLLRIGMMVSGVVGLLSIGYVVMGLLKWG